MKGRKMMAWLLLFVCVLAAVPGMAELSGTCGNDMAWRMEGEDTLIISGTGKMDDYSYDAPWFSPNIRSIVIEEGVTQIGDMAFYGCGQSTEIIVPASVKDIGNYAIPDACILVVDRNSWAWDYARNYGYTFRIRGEEQPRQTGARTVKEIVREAVANETSPDMNDYQKALALHNWLARHCEYDYEFATSARYSASGALLGGIAVCSGYSNAYALLLSEAGIENRLVYGDNRDDHVWNAAKLDGQWCHIDVTWDDEPFQSGFHHEFFAITEYALREVENHQGFRTSFACDSYQTSYAYRTGVLGRIADGWMEEIAAHIRKGETVFDTAEVINAAYVIGASHIDYGISPRMTAQMLQDTGITVDGRYYPIAKAVCNSWVKDNGFYGFSLSITLDTGDPNCGAQQIQKGEHVFSWNAGTAAGCLTGGTEACWICSHCGQKYRGTGCLTPLTGNTDLPAKGHTLEHHEEMPPVCDDPGTEEYWQCTACGMYFCDERGRFQISGPEEIPARGHRMTPVRVESREEKDWIYTEVLIGVCMDCDEILKVERKRSTAALPGDVTGDGVVDGRDVIRLMRYLAGEEDAEINEANADVNLNGKADEPDILRLVKYLGGEIPDFGMETMAAYFP